MQKSTDNTASSSFFEKEEVKKLRCSYLDKIGNEINILENHARKSLSSEGKIPVNEDFYAMVHKMKGVGGTFKFPLITDAAIEILQLFTVKAKTNTCYLTEEQGYKLLDIIENMRNYVKNYKNEMGM